MTKQSLSETFRAFRHRNYALFFAGQSVSQIGTWMQRTAINWVIYSLTHSAFMLGLAVFAQQFPSFLLSLYGGIISDRYSRYKILLVTQTASMVQAILLAALILTNHYVIWEILALGALLGVVNAFDVPARQPMVHEMVTEKDDIPNALALNSAMVNIARLIGPALSGIVLQSFGAGICFSLNALSFVAVIGSLLLMKLPKFVPPTTKKKAIAELKEGLQYLKQTPAIGNIILLVVVLSIFILPYDTVIPVFAKVIFSGDARTYGYINSFVGLGAIGGSFFFASQKRGANLRKVLLLSVAILAIGLILFSATGYLPLALPFAAIVGFGSLLPVSVSITTVQLEAAANMRGRVMSFMALSFFGMLPLGSLLVGFLSQKTSAPLTMMGQGIAGLIIAAIFYRILIKPPVKKITEEELSAADTVTINQTETSS